MATIVESEPRRVVGGVDTHKDTHVAAVIDTVGRSLASESFPATRHGYQRLLSWLRSHGELDAGAAPRTAAPSRTRHPPPARRDTQKPAPARSAAGRSCPPPPHPARPTPGSASPAPPAAADRAPPARGAAHATPVHDHCLTSAPPRSRRERPRTVSAVPTTSGHGGRPPTTGFHRLDEPGRKVLLAFLALTESYSLF
jgi:hypothetical protein